MAIGAARADGGEGGHHSGIFGREEVERAAGVEEPDGYLRDGCGDWWRTNKGKSGRGRTKMSARTNEQRERRVYAASSTLTSIVAVTHCSELPPSDEPHESSSFTAKFDSVATSRSDCHRSCPDASYCITSWAQTKGRGGAPMETESESEELRRERELYDSQKKKFTS
jgi:hypothetical protein